MVKFGRHLQFYLESVEGSPGPGPGHGPEGKYSDSNIDQNIPNIYNNTNINHNYNHDNNNNFSIEQTSSFDKHRSKYVDEDDKHHEQMSTLSHHYIVPYNMLRNAIESSPVVEQGHNHNYEHQNHRHQFNEYDMTPSSFEQEWREALQKSNSDFFESINSCWKGVFDSISEHLKKNNTDDNGVDDISSNNMNSIKDAMRGIELMDAIQLYTQLNDIVSSRDLLCFLKDTYNIAEINYQALRKIVKKFDKKYYSIHGACAGTINSHKNGYSHGNANNCEAELLSATLLPELYSSTLYFGRMTLKMAIDTLRLLMEEMASTSSSSSGGSDDGSRNGNNINSSNDSSIDVQTEQQGFMIGPDGYGHHYQEELQQQQLKDQENHKAETTEKIVTLPALIPPKSLQYQSSKQLKAKKEKIIRKIDNHRHSYHGQDLDQDDLEEEVVVNNKRADEIMWLNDVVKTIPKSELKHIVAHRGFHTSQGRSDYRPLENSLSAFETAWSAGIRLCECDIALTKDEKLVLAHDEDFNRLALDKTSECSRLKVSELTFKELIALTLKNGVRAPLLKDVLSSANAIGPEAKLIIEIKPGNSEAAMALARFLGKYPELMVHVDVIMSFDLWSMHSLCAELRRHFPHLVDGDSDASSFLRRPKSTSILGSSPGEYSFLMEPSRRERSDSLITYHTLQQLSLPKLMLLTVADQPENRFELCVDCSDYSPIGGWLHSTYTSLDGVYVRFQPEMLLPEGKTALQKLTEKYTVGIWGKAGEDPDDQRTIQYLVKECGVSFINTDLPRTF